MSCGEVFTLNLIPIKDVNKEIVQRAGKFVVEENNRIHGHRFIYKHVVNGLSDPNINVEPRFYIIMIEVINDDGIHWSYITNVKYYVQTFNMHIL